MKILYYIVPFLFFLAIPTCHAKVVGVVALYDYVPYPLPVGVTGPETIAFDHHGKGPYVGVSDGRILLLEGNTWTEFATMPNWHSGCNGSISSEPTCGRPLGLMFHPNTHDLYVADAYNGLVVVDKSGGRAVPVAGDAQGKSFKFTNSLDIDPKTDIVYFTDSSTRFQRRQFANLTNTFDNTSRLLSYNPHTNKVQVLYKGLQFANGVALSQNSDFLVVSETTTGKVHKFWLKGPKHHTIELLRTFKGHPDNVNRDPYGNFWIAQVPVEPLSSSNYYGGIPVKIDEHGKVLERLAMVLRASEVKERSGKLWIGSVLDSSILVADKSKGCISRAN